MFSHASGRTVGGVVEQQGCPDLIAAGTFWFSAFTNNSRKGREALRQTLQTMMWEMPDQIRGRTLLCKVDNQALKAIIEKKESTECFP